MRSLRSFLARLLSLPRRQKLISEIDEELAFHVERETEANIAKGMFPENARREALVAFGSPDGAGEACTEQHTFRFVEATLQDARHTVRGIRRNPLFTLTIVVTLALGIGANTALFSVVNALLLRNLPYQDANHLVYVAEFWPHEPGVPGPPSPDFFAWRSRARTFESLEAYGTSASLNLTGAGEAGRFDTTQVSPGFLSMLGVKPALGRNFSREEGLPGGPPVVILGHQLWQRRFASSTGAIGRQIELEGKLRTVVGVLPASFLFPDNNFGADLLLPMQLDPGTVWSEQDFRLLRVLARPKPGITAEEMRKEFADIVRSTASQEPPQFITMRKDMLVTAVPLRQWLSGDVRPLLLVLQAAVAMILLIACLNVANLQIGRAVTRQKEIALRTSLGATRARVTRQLLTESLLLGLLGGTAGVIAGALGLSYLRAFFPSNLHLVQVAHVDPTVMLFTLVVTVLTGIVTGLAATVTAYKTTLNDTLGGGQQIDWHGWLPWPSQDVGDRRGRHRSHSLGRIGPVDSKFSALENSRSRLRSGQPAYFADSTVRQEISQLRKADRLFFPTSGTWSGIARRASRSARIGFAADRFGKRCGRRC